MSVSSNLLCSFELLKPLDSSALKSHIKRGRNARQNMLNSPVCGLLSNSWSQLTTSHSLHKYRPRVSKQNTSVDKYTALVTVARRNDAP